MYLVSFSLPFLSLWFSVSLCTYQCLCKLLVPPLGLCACMHLCVSMHEACVCVCLHMHVYMSVFVFVTLSLHLARTQIVEDGERVSERSPGLPLSGLGLGRALARCLLWLFMGQAPGCLGINSYFPTPELSGS